MAGRTRRATDDVEPRIGHMTSFGRGSFKTSFKAKNLGLIFWSLDEGLERLEP
jgi:hypothetical protein